METSVHIIVKGKVQGVWFRKFTQRKAKELKLRGWVRNLPNGDVEATATGEEQVVNAFIECLKVGPAAAKVQEVQVQDWEGEVEPGFRIIY